MSSSSRGARVINGQVQQDYKPGVIETLSSYFWSALHGAQLFVQSLLNPEALNQPANSNARTNFRQPSTRPASRGAPDVGPRRPMGRVGGGCAINQSGPMGGGG